MTFKECSDKYPIGSVVGTFSFGKSCSIKMVKHYLHARSEYSNLFFIKSEDEKYYAVEPWIKECEGYVTADGLNFTAYYLTDEGCMYDFDKGGDFFFEGDYTRKDIIKKFLDHYPDYKIIDSIFDLDCEF